MIVYYITDVFPIVLWKEDRAKKQGVLLMHRGAKQSGQLFAIHSQTQAEPSGKCIEPRCSSMQRDDESATEPRRAVYLRKKRGVKHRDA